jgi:hypothetical protein
MPGAEFTAATTKQHSRKTMRGAARFLALDCRRQNGYVTGFRMTKKMIGKSKTAAGRRSIPLNDDAMAALLRLTGGPKQMASAHKITMSSRD